MKIYISLVITLLLSLQSFSQEKRIIGKYVSDEIKRYITDQYPSAQKIKFYQETQNDSIFIEAEFHVGKTEISFKFFENRWIEKETELAYEEIAEEIKAKMNHFLSTEYTKHKISESYLVETSKKNNQFELYVKGTKNKASNFYEICFDEKGNYIKSELMESTPIQSLY
jgi:hypothetical protein